MNVIENKTMNVINTINKSKKLFYYSYSVVLSKYNIKNYLFWLDINDRIKRHPITKAKQTDFKK